MKSLFKIVTLSASIFYLLIFAVVVAVVFNVLRYEHDLQDYQKFNKALYNLESKVNSARYDVQNDSAQKISGEDIFEIKKSLTSIRQTLPQHASPEVLRLMAEATSKLEGNGQTFIVKINNNASLNNTTASIASLHGIILETISLVEIEVNNLNLSVKLVSAIGFLSLIIGYASFPIYNHFRFKRPAKKLSQVLNDTVQGKEIALNEIQAGDALSELESSVKRIVEVQKRSKDFIEHIGNNDGVSVEAGDDPMMRSLLSMQEKLNQMSAREASSAWVSENLGILEKLLKSESDQQKLATEAIALISKSISAGVGVLYGMGEEKIGEPYFYPLAAYGFYNNTKTPKRISVGEGLLGEVGVYRKPLHLSNLPKNYMVIHSGLGSSSPSHLVVMPLIFKDGLYGAIELASFRPFDARETSLLERVSESLAAHLFNQKINSDAKKKLEELADKQAQELVEVHRLQEQTFHKLEMKLKEVEEEKIKNEAILDGCVDGVISFDERGFITFCNKAALDIWGYSQKEEMLQKRIFELIPIRIDFADNKLRSYFMASTEKEIGVRTEASIVDKQEQRIDVLITSTQCEVQSQVVFTFFLQKISVDLF